MGKQDHIKNALTSQGQNIYNLLLEMYPQHKEIIEYHYSGTQDLPFAEWFAFLFDLDKWELEGPHVFASGDFFVSDSALANLKEDYAKSLEGERFFRNSDLNPKNVDFSKLPPITATQPDDLLRVVDGYHRWYLAYMANKNIKGYLWVKKPNNHPNAMKVKDCIIKNLL